MTVNDLATAGFIDERFRYIIAELARVVPAAPAPAPAEVVLYSYKKLAQVLDVTVETVSAWVNKGKRVQGRVVKLQVYRFTSEPRVPWPALLAYERGEDFDLASLPAPLLLPPKELEPAPLPRQPEPADAPHLQVA
jgi:hypothetical protein